EDVLTPRDLRVEAGAELDQRGDAPAHVERAGGGLADAGDALQERALATPVAADDAVRPAGLHVERHVVERPERLVGPQVAHEAAREDRALERGELALVLEAPVDLRDVARLDRQRAHHTSSANESRRRSKMKYPKRNRSTEPAPS